VSVGVIEAAVTALDGEEGDGAGAAHQASGSTVGFTGVSMDRRASECHATAMAVVVNRARVELGRVGLRFERLGARGVVQLCFLVAHPQLVAAAGCAPGLQA